MQSNPDAAPELSGEERAIKESKSAAAAAKLLIAPSAERCIGWASGGSCHYKKVNRSTYEAGYAASVSCHHFWFGPILMMFPVQVRIIRRIEEAFQHVASGRRIEDLPPMKELKPGTIITPERSSPFPPKSMTILTNNLFHFQLYQTQYMMLEVLCAFASFIPDLELEEMPLIPLCLVPRLRL